MAKESQVTGAPVVSIVDDDQSVRDRIGGRVAAKGFEAKSFECAEEFLHSSRVGGASCLVTAMRMTGMSGHELHQRLVAAGKSIPTIVVNAFPIDANGMGGEHADVVC